MTLTKIRLVERICDRTGYSKKRSAEIFETLLETMKQHLASGEEVLIRGFGKFSVKENNGRKRGNSPLSRQSALDAKRVIYFISAPVLKKKINQEVID